MVKVSVLPPPEMCILKDVCKSHVMGAWEPIGEWKCVRFLKIGGLYSETDIVQQILLRE